MAKEKREEEVPISEISLNETERGLIVRGLDKIISEVEKVSISADRLTIKKAAKEVQVYKHEIEQLKNKVLGKVPLL